jgi:hypothetical protein
MKLTKSQLKQIIKEELQQEGFLDFFKRKKGPSRWWLHPETPTDFPHGGTPEQYEAMVKETTDFLDDLGPSRVSDMFFNSLDYPDKLGEIPQSIDWTGIGEALPQGRSWDIWSAEVRKMMDNRNPGLPKMVYEYLKSYGDYENVVKQVQRYRYYSSSRNKDLSRSAWIALRRYFKNKRPEIEKVKEGIDNLLKGDAPQEVMDAFKLAVLVGSWGRIPGAGSSTEKIPSMHVLYITLLDLTDRERSSRIDAKWDTDTGWAMTAGRSPRWGNT